MSTTVRNKGKLIPFEGDLPLDFDENPDGTINFHTMHYNGGASLEEVIEEEL